MRSMNDAIKEASVMEEMRDEMREMVAGSLKATLGT